jgi:hypothetical protein
MITIEYSDTKIINECRKHNYLITVSHDNGNKFTFNYKVVDTDGFFQENIMKEVINSIISDFDLFVVRDFVPNMDWAESVMCNKNQQETFDFYCSAKKYSDGIKDVFSQNFLDTIRILKVLK